MAIGGLMPWIDFDHRMMVMDDGLECCMICPVWSPISNYDEY